MRFRLHPRHVEKIGQGVEPCGSGKAGKFSCHVGDIFRDARRVRGWLAQVRSRILCGLSRLGPAPSRPGVLGLSRAQDKCR